MHSPIVKLPTFAYLCQRIQRISFDFELPKGGDVANEAGDYTATFNLSIGDTGIHNLQADETDVSTYRPMEQKVQHAALTLFALCPQTTSTQNITRGAIGTMKNNSTYY